MTKLRRTKKRENHESMIIFRAKLISFKKQLTRLKLSFSTKDPIDELVLSQITGVEGFLAFSEDQFKASVEKAMAERKIGISEEGKSDSQVLRGTLFKIWNLTAEEILWEPYYHREMQRINSHYVKKYINRESR
jgi:phosphotransferase system IIB component